MNELDDLNHVLEAICYIVGCEACGARVYIEAAKAENETHWQCPECNAWTAKEVNE